MMVEERTAVLLDGGREVAVVLVAGTSEFMAKALGGLPSRTGVATLSATKSAVGEPLVSVLMGSKHMGFLPRAEAQALLPVVTAHDEAGADTRAKAVISLAPGDPSRGVMKVRLSGPAPSPDAPPLAAVATAPARPAAPPRAPDVTAPAADMVFAAPVVFAPRSTLGPLATPAPPAAAKDLWTPAPGPRGPTGASAAADLWAQADAAEAGPPWASNVGPAGRQQPAGAAGQMSVAPRRASAQSQSWLQRHPGVIKIGVAVVTAVVAFVIVHTLVGSKWDNKETFLWGELYYTDQVNKTEAQKLGAFWEVTYEAGDEDFTLALDRSESSFELSMILEDQDRFNPDVPQVMELLGQEMATLVFPGSSVSILVCNEHFEPYTAYGPYYASVTQ